MARKRDPWCCPRCGLEGDHLKSPDPARCTHCCRVDAADDLYAALVALSSLHAATVREQGYVVGTEKTLATVRAVLAKARGETP